MLQEIVGGPNPRVIHKVEKLSMELPEPPGGNGDIQKLLQQTVLFGGKRLRPLLLFLMADYFALEGEEVDICARAIEMVHGASLSHDDVVDQASTRRGNPSINVVSSNKRAVLAGDYLLSNVIVELTQLENLELVREMSLVIAALSEGEWLQLDAAQKRDYSPQLISRVAFCKTASVMSWCTVAPALLKGLSPQVVQYARDLGGRLGVAFQLLDDILDFSMNSEKELHLDLKNGVVNRVLYEWFTLWPEIYQKFREGEKLLDLFHGERLDEAKSRVRQKAMENLDQCRQLLKLMEGELAEIISPAHLKRAERPLLSLFQYLADRKK